MRKSLPFLLLAGLFGCSQSVRVADYSGPQRWPQGRPSTCAVRLADAPVLFGLPNRPYEVTQIVEIARKGPHVEDDLAAAQPQLGPSRADAFLLIGSKYDRLLDVEQYLAQATEVDPGCISFLKQIRKKNLTDPANNYVLLAISWRPEQPVPAWRTASHDGSFKLYQPRRVQSAAGLTSRARRTPTTNDGSR